MSSEATLTHTQSQPEQQPQEIWQRMADFIVNAEFSRHSSTKDEPSLKIRQLAQEKAQQIDRQLREIRGELKHFNDVMSRVGAIQWRNESARLMSEGQQEVKTLEQSYYELKNVMTTQCEQLNRASMNTVKNVAQLVSGVRTSTIKKLNEEKSLELQQACDHNLQKVGHIVKSFHWKNLALTVVLSLMVSMIVSLYIDDAWPWQMHDKVVKERAAGQILINAWPQLSRNDQDTINESA